MKIIKQKIKIQTWEIDENGDAYLVKEKPAQLIFQEIEIKGEKEGLCTK